MVFVERYNDGFSFFLDGFKGVHSLKLWRAGLCLVCMVLFLFCLWGLFWHFLLWQLSGILNYLLFSSKSCHFIKLLFVCRCESLWGFKISCFTKFEYFNGSLHLGFKIQEWTLSLFFDYLSATSWILIPLRVYKLLCLEFLLLEPEIWGVVVFFWN